MTSSTADFGRDYAYEQLRRSRHPLRRLVKSLYLRNILRDIDGPTIDFGCGAGQLLARLPRGSVGIELNPHLIRALTEAGLDVRAARGDISDFDLASLEVGGYSNLVIAHVLEHLDDPLSALSRLLIACRRLGITRVVVVVPGAKGYRFDPTHKTFIDRQWLVRHPLPSSLGFVMRGPTYFPGPEAVGRYFVFHEMKIVFEAHRPAESR